MCDYGFGESACKEPPEFKTLNQPAPFLLCRLHIERMVSSPFELDGLTERAKEAVKSWRDTWIRAGYSEFFNTILDPAVVSAMMKPK